MWHVSAPHRPCIGHRTGYSLHENARISGLASADFEGVFAHSYNRWRPRLFLRALRRPKVRIADSYEHLVEWVKNWALRRLAKN
jgi:hypothetical protein